MARPLLLFAAALLLAAAPGRARAQDDGDQAGDGQAQDQQQDQQGQGSDDALIPGSSDGLTNYQGGSAIGIDHGTLLGAAGAAEASSAKKKRGRGAAGAEAADGGLAPGGAVGGLLRQAAALTGGGAPGMDVRPGGSRACPLVSFEPKGERQPKFSLADMVVENSPGDVASYAVTTDITSLDVTKDGFKVDFTKKDGLERWPDVTTPGWDGPLQYTLWIVEAIGGAWYASGPIEYWHGLERSGGPPSRIYDNWFYARDRWGPMACHQPRVGERVGFFVTHGDARNNGNGSHPLKQRSNIVWVEYPADAGGVYSF